jgi:hypothetical protein
MAYQHHSEGFENIVFENLIFYYVIKLYWVLHTLEFKIIHLTAAIKRSEIDSKTDK